MTGVDLAVPMSGWLCPLAEAPDEAFAGGLLGDGVAIDPAEGVVRAPCDGTVVALAQARHAVTIEAANGAHILLHVGIDTVALGGHTFAASVAVGQQVARGDVLLTFDLDYVARNARSVMTPVVLANGDTFRIARRAPVDRSVTDQDYLMSVSPRSAVGDTPDAAPADGADEASRDATVSMPHGLHARPAARVAGRAKAFAARITLSLDDTTANAKSPTALMGLGARHGDRLLVAASGPDAADAVHAVASLLEAGAGDDVAPDQPAAVAAIDGEQVLRGVCAAPGLAVGPVFVLARDDIDIDADAADAAAERARLDAALATLGTRIAGRQTAQGSDIFGAHLALLDDDDLVQSTRALIQEGRSATFAWRAVMRQQAARLGALEDARLAERAADFLDLERQLLSILTGRDEDDALAAPAGAILVADELYPSDMAGLATAGIAGLCTARGGPTSHVAILAAAMDLPAVVAAGTPVLGAQNGATAVLNADDGILHLSPADTDIAAAVQKLEQRAARRMQAVARAHETCRTADGVRIHVVANLGAVADAAAAVAAGAEGCGLLRTEFLFLDRDTAPDEDEQHGHYQEIANALDTRPLVVRTLDIGADKPARYVGLAGEPNPALGVRGIRLALRHPDLLDTQLRALVRVTPPGRCSIMVPMVSSVDELLAVRQRLEAIVGETGVKDRPPLGVMVETPAAALIADRLAEHADFLSIGTNDLTQYTLAMDRGHQDLAEQFDALHPAVLRLIDVTAKAGRRHGRWVGVCGGLASDPLAAPILIGLGVTELSAIPARVPDVKGVVRALRGDDCAAVARQALDLGSAADVRALVRQRVAQVSDWT